MSDNDVNSANGQYDHPPFGMHGIAGTGAPGTGGGGSTYSQYGDGRLPGESVAAHALTSTGAPGSAPGVPPADGGQVSVTNGGHAGIPDGVRVGTTNTSKEAMSDPFVHGGSFGGGDFVASDTGAGSGTARTERP